MHGPVHPPGWENPSRAHGGYGDTTGFSFSSHQHQNVEDGFQGVHYDHQHSNLGEVCVEPRAIFPIQNVEKYEYYNKRHHAGDDVALTGVNHSHDPWRNNLCKDGQYEALQSEDHQRCISGLWSTYPVVNTFHENGFGFDYNFEHHGQQHNALPILFDPLHVPKYLNSTPNLQPFSRQLYLPSFENEGECTCDNHLQGIINKHSHTFARNIEPTLAQQKMAEKPKYEVGSKLGTATRPQEPAHLVGKEKPCQHCQSVATSFKYFSNKNPNQPRYRCNNCKKDFTYDGKKYKKLMWYLQISSGGLGKINHMKNEPERRDTENSKDGLGELDNLRSKEEEPNIQMLDSKYEAQETTCVEIESLESFPTSPEFLMGPLTKEEPTIENIDYSAFWDDKAFWNDQDGIGSLISSLSPPWDADPLFFPS